MLDDSIFNIARDWRRLVPALSAGSRLARAREGMLPRKPAPIGHGAVIRHGGRTFVVAVCPDEDACAPWEREDGHGEVRHVCNRESKAPGERPLHEDRGGMWLYDWKGAIQTARRDGRDAPPYQTGTRGQRAARAVQADFDHLQGWLSGRWHYVGVMVAEMPAEGFGVDWRNATAFADDLAYGDGSALRACEDMESLWGIESIDEAYIGETALELVEGLA